MLGFSGADILDGLANFLDTDKDDYNKTQNEETEEDKVKESRSVIEGGTVEGWSPLLAVVLWRRFLGIIGNVNEIQDAEAHASVFGHLMELWEMLETVCLIFKIILLFEILFRN